MKIMLKDVRLSFPNLFRRAVFNGEEGKFGATFLIPKESAQAKTVRDAIAALIKDALKGAKLGPDKLCLRDGDEAEWEGYAGHLSLKASNASRPLVIGRDKAPVAEEDGVVYAGCHVNAQVELWAQDNQFGRRVNASLLGVQFVRDGQPFGDGGRTSKLDDFDDLGAPDEDSPLLF